MRLTAWQSPLLTAGVCTLLGLGGCFGEDGDEGDQAASDYGLAVERVSDEVREQTTAALTTLNRAADGKLSGAAAAAELREIQRRVSGAAEELGGLTPPEDAAASAKDLAAAADDIALH